MAGDYWEKKVEETMESRYENTGSLFGNSSKKLETHPDYQGLLKADVEVDGQIVKVVFKLSGWVKVKQDGAKWIALKVLAMKTKTMEDANEAEKDNGPEEAF